MEKQKPLNILELTKTHKETVLRLEELREKFQKVNPDLAVIISNLLEDFLAGSITSVDALRRARLIRDSLES